MWITPPRAARALIMSSVILRGELQIARQQECDAITGAREASRTSLKVSSDTWEISTDLPSRCRSQHTALPNSVRPLCRGEWFDESAQSVGALCVSVM